MTDRPLYRLREGSGVTLTPDGNAGLWYDKFSNEWVIRHGSAKFEKSGDDSKRNWVATVTKRHVGDSNLLDHTYGRRSELVKACNGELRCFKAASRFVTGLGREHPVGNGLAWHPTLGTPYLPGSSVKGLVRAWALEEYGDKEGTKLSAKARRIFGVPEEGGDARTGSVIFMDALPHQPVKLETDVMTPHYQDYYQGNEPPADWISPNPIPFLVVAKNTEFYFSLLPRTPDAAEDVALAAKWLDEALLWLGAGAKTAVGYGRFEKVSVPAVPSAWEAAREVARRAKLSPLQRTRLEAREMSAKEALDWTRDKLDAELSREDPLVQAKLEIIIERFYEKWLQGDPGDPLITNLSADKLRNEYAHKLVPPPSKEDEKTARFRHLPEVESRRLIEIHDRPENARTNPLLDAATAAMQDSWTVEGIQFLLEIMEEQGWAKKKAKKNKDYKKLKKHLEGRKS